MTATSPIPRRVAVVAHPQVPEAPSEAAAIAGYLNDRGVFCQSGLLYDEALRNEVRAGNFDLLIALGGDGTMLRAGHLAGPCNLPILGVNMGRLGFLMEISRDEWRLLMPRLLNGDYWLEKRMMITAEQWRGGERLGSWQVINEVAVSRGQLLRPVHLVTFVDGLYLTTYVADALIASTPTGSTAYVLAAGGPILPPELRNMVLVAVAPHLSLDRAIVLDEASTVSVTVHTDHQAVLSVDGQVPVGVADGDKITARASEHSVQFVRFQDRGYFYRNLTAHMNHNPSTEI
jgi:NAD+ kinase